MKKVGIIIAFAMIFLSLTFVSASYSIDISGLKQSYSIGEEISYTVLLLQDGKIIDKNVDAIFSDDFGRREIKKTVLSNVKNTLLVDENFSSLGWHVKATYEGKEVVLSFVIQENSKVEFSIDGNKFIIKNKGNVVYSKDVKVRIGNEENVYTQNIPVGGEKVWILVAPEGTYNI